MIFPTETVYGLGADALNAKAVARIFEIKRRPLFDPLIVHVSDLRQADRLARVSPAARALMRRFWPGPLTLVLPKKKIVPDIVTAGLPTVAVRMPGNKYALALIGAAGTPVAAPSANRFGSLSPTTASHTRSRLGCGADMTLDGGRAEIGVESTVLACAADGFRVLRHGGLPLEDLEPFTGPLDSVIKGGKKPSSPGQLAAHYAPSAGLALLGKKRIRLRKDLKYGYLAFRRAPDRSGLWKRISRTAVLSRSGDLKEAAANLFSHLHTLDKAGVDIILAEPVPELGLGRAIMDRLRRAEKGEGGRRGGTGPGNR